MDEIIYGSASHADRPAKDIQSCIRHIRGTISAIKDRYLMLGFYLNEANVHGYYKELGYDDFYAFCETNFQMDKSAVSRSINLWETFAAYDKASQTREIQIDTRYADYSYSQLCEMLPLTDKERLQISPDMSIKQIREKKKEWRQSEMAEPVATSQPNADGHQDDAPERHDEEWFVRQYWERESRFHSQIADLCANEPSNTKLGKEIQKLIAPYDCQSYVSLEWESDFRGYSTGVFFEAGNEQIQMTYTRLAAGLREICKENKSELAVDVVSEVQDEPLKLSTYGTTARVYPEEAPSLDPKEEAVAPPEQPTIEPQEVQYDLLPVFKNDDQRKKWLDNYKEWGLWYHDEHIDVNYYKYDFPDGSRLIAVEYPDRELYWSGEKYDELHFHLVGIREKICTTKPGLYNHKFCNAPDSVTYLVGFLKKVQKEYLEEVIKNSKRGRAKRQYSDR